MNAQVQMVDVENVDTIGFECSQCGTEVLVNITKMAASKKEEHIPYACPSCKVEMVPLSHSIGEYVKFYLAAKDKKPALRFRITTPAQ